tara:strand:+ start:1019 stop:1297 length:279 start_codon:yes stop_codon:yes gene_type:complete
MVWNKPGIYPFRQAQQVSILVFQWNGLELLFGVIINFFMPRFNPSFSMEWSGTATAFITEAISVSFNPSFSMEWSGTLVIKEGEFYEAEFQS